MAYLLGSKTCIDSLRIDIDDLQNVIYDIIGKTGSIKCHSWKFPDKLATDVDINELLERYQYGTNELDNQVSHVVLFEIVIDRLLLVLHGSWRFLHEIQTKLFPNTIDSSSTINQQTSLSVGLVVKKYWNKLLHISTTLQQHKIRPDDIERINRKPSKSNLTTEKHCQTIQTSFSPCSSCIKLQQCLRDYSDGMINICNLYNLPSSLAYHRCSMSTIPEWLSSDDINHWFDCQSKDFDRLSKHIEYLNNTLNKTKNDLDLSENHCKQQNETNQRLQKIIQDDKQLKKNLQEAHENKLIEIKNEYDRHEVNFNEQIKLLTTQRNNLEQQLKEINDEYISRGEQLQKLESSKNELKILNEDRLKSDELIKTLEQNLIRLQTELDIIKHDLEERNHDLKKERIRIENMIRQEENYQSKQKILTKSYEELSQECQSLKKQITELELQRDQLQKTNNHLLQEITSLKSNIDQQINEREQNSSSQTMTNKLVDDMQNQMRTHEIRIDLLQKENDSLKFSLEKLLISNKLSIVTEERHEQSKQEQSSSHKLKQTPLWLLNTEIIEQQQQAFTTTRPVTTANYIPRSSENDYTANGRFKSDTDVSQQYGHSRITTDLMVATESRPATRAPSSQTLTLTIPPASDHEMILGKGRTKISNRPLSFEHTRRNISSAKTRRSSTAHITHRCTTCNKSYDDKRNYDLHKLYCRT